MNAQAQAGSMTAADPTYSLRWLVLAVVGIAQLMVVLDATVVNIAHPSTKGRCGFQTASANGSSLATRWRSGASSRSAVAGSSLVNRVAQTSSRDHDVRASAA